MNLRTRLALLNTVIVGGILLLFGTAVYIAVTLTLVGQVDDRLERAYRSVIRIIRYDDGQLAVGNLPSGDLSREVYIQVWGTNNDLQYSSANIPLNYRRPLDPVGLSAADPVYRNVSLEEEIRLRVLSIPLEVSERWIGTLQVASSLSGVDAVQELFLSVLFAGLLLAVLIAGVAGGAIARYALKPLDIVTETALQITRADDLSRRIPYDGPPNDEVGELIRAFNQTLGRLENLFETQRRFVADVGHELRTPLTVIKGNVDLMRRIECADEESLDSIENETDRLNRLVGDLLLLAQAESGKLPMLRMVVELDTLVLEVMNQMRVVAGNKVQMKLVEIDQVLVCGDQDRLKQVLLNLIGNAIKYTPPGGTVSISLGKEKDTARLSVADTGPGIPEEDLPHIFERFYRGEKSRTRSREGKGFGLGLSIAYWIVRAHEGQIDVDSGATGTRFTVRLPLAVNGECPPLEAE